MKNFARIAGFAALAAASVAVPASAATITEGFTFAVANSGPGTGGTHFHSSTGGDFGNAAGQAEVGGFFSETIRGLSEYDLSGLPAADSAFVTFTINVEGGLFGQSPFTGTVNVVAYQGNNFEDLSDFEAVSLGTVGSFSLSPEANDVGDVFSFDITTIYNSFIAANNTSLGIRLEGPEGTGQAWTFNNFRLTSDNQGIPAVPEPATWAMMVLGFGAVGASLRARRRATAVAA